MSADQDDVQEVLEVARLHCERGDFKIASAMVTRAAIHLERLQDFVQYLNCQNLLLRMYAEMEDFVSIQAIKEKLQQLVSNHHLELNAKTYYTLALCASYKNENHISLEYLEKSLALALAKEDQKDICYATHGLAVVYFSLGFLEDSCRELQHLETFFQRVNVPDLKLSAQIMKGHILRKVRKYDEALEVFWSAYGGLQKQKNLYMYINIIYAIGITYLDSGNMTLGKMYLTLAKRAIDPDNLRYFSRRIESRMEAIESTQGKSYDLIFNVNSHSVVEFKKGAVDFKNQFVLLDLLRVFLKSPGEVYSKEALVGAVWRQNYDPAVHDNKIYVTIKRLRRLIEPDFEKPKYIFRAKNGYYLNKNARILIES